MDLRENTKPTIRFWIILAAIMISLIYAVISAFSITAETRHYNLTVTDMDNVWQTEDGTTRNLTALPAGRSVLYADVSGMDLSHMRFCAKSIDTYFDLYADGEKIYSYEYEQPYITGVSYGMNMHMVPLPEGTKELRLELYSVFEKEAPVLAVTRIADAGMYMGDVFSHGIPSFCVCVIMLLIGIVTMIIGMSGTMKAEFVTLGLFASFTALWSVNDTMMLQLITQKPEIVRCISYISFILIPYAPASFIAHVTGSKRKLPLTLLAIAVLLNLIVCVFLNASHIADFHKTAGISRAVIAVTMIMCIIFTATGIRRKIMNRRLLITLSTSVFFGVSGAVIDYLRYAFTESAIEGSGLFTRIGIFIFLMIFMVYIVTDYSNARIERSKAELMSHLAYTDALTGLDNRLSFNEREADLKSQKGTSCIIIQLDINNLKLVNDVYGHSEGDRHIRSAADIIRKSFEEHGICYRTGGDEFITVISPKTDESITKASIETMKKLCEEYNEKENPPVPLQIAYGYAVCRDTSTQLEPTELLADQRMYDCKREMKSNAPA